VKLGKDGKSGVRRLKSSKGRGVPPMVLDMDTKGGSESYMARGWPDIIWGIEWEKRLMVGLIWSG